MSGSSGNQAWNEDEIRIDESGKQAVTGQHQPDVADRLRSHTTMRPRKQGDERADPAAQAEYRVPPNPRLPLQDEIFEGPAKVSDHPQPDADREGVPEQAMAAGPTRAAPDDDDADRDRGQQQADVAEDRQPERMPAQEPPEGRIRQHVTNANREIYQVWHREGAIEFS